MDHEEYIRRVKSYIKTPTKDLEQQLEEFCGFCTYISGQYDQDDSFINLRKHLEELEQGRKETNRVFYMALPPSVFITVSQHLKRNCYPKNGIARVIVSLMCAIEADSHDPNQRAIRLRSLLAKILPVRGNFKRLSDPTGKKTKSTALIIIWVRRWSRISLSCDLATNFSALPGTGTTLITSK